MPRKRFAVHVSKIAYSYLAKSLSLATEYSTACRIILVNALSCNDPALCAVRISRLPLNFTEQFDSKRILVSCSRLEHQAIESAAQTLGVDANQVCSTLINNSLLASHNCKTDLGTLTPVNNTFQPNINQSSLISHLTLHDWLSTNQESPLNPRQSIEGANVYCAELGENTGKTVLALFLATHEASLGNRTWIAVPSFTEQQNLLREFNSKFSHLPTSTLALMSCRQEFVSHRRLSELIDQEIATTRQLSVRRQSTANKWTAQAQEWIKVHANSPMGQDRRQWLMASFLHHVPNFPYADIDICLNTFCQSDDVGELSYQAQLDLVSKCQIAVLTHHCLYYEIHARRKSYFDKPRKYPFKEAEKLSLVYCYIHHEETKRNPEPQNLLVDDAHLLTKTFTSASKQTISVRRIPHLYLTIENNDEVKTKRLYDYFEDRTSQAFFDLSAQGILGHIASKIARLYPGKNEHPFSFARRGAPDEVDMIRNLADALDQVLSKVQITGKSTNALTLGYLQMILHELVRRSAEKDCFFANSSLTLYPQLSYTYHDPRNEFNHLFRRLGIQRSLLLTTNVHTEKPSGAWSFDEFLKTMDLVRGESVRYRCLQEFIRSTIKREPSENKHLHET